MKEKRKSLSMKIIKGLGITVIIIVLLLGGFVGYLSITEYKPSDIEKLVVETKTENVLSAGDTISYPGT